MSRSGPTQLARSVSRQPVCGVAGLKTTFGLVSTQGVYPISPTYLDTVGPMAKDVNGLVEGMELLQEDFDTLYAKARASKPSARQIRIGLLRVPGTDPAIDRAIEARLVERGFQIVPLGQEFLKAWRQAQRDGNLVAAAASWYNNQAIRREEGVGWRARIAIWFGDIVFSHKYSDEAKRQQAIARRDEWRNTLLCVKSFRRSVPSRFPFSEKHHRNGTCF
jgi:amidase